MLPSIAHVVVMMKWKYFTLADVVTDFFNVHLWKAFNYISDDVSEIVIFL